MTKKKVDVDLGPISFPVGEDTKEPKHPPSQNDLDQDSVLRFRAMMERPIQGRPMVTEDLDLPTPFSLLGAPDPKRSHDTAEIGMEIEHLWVGDGVDGIREVLVGIAREVLPETSVRLYEGDGRLQIHMTVGGEATRIWLASELHNLTLDLGERLQRPLRVAVLNVNSTESALASCDWPEDFRR
jgi:hypothetical protein